jgi:small subunit ribosomal protein S16
MLAIKLKRVGKKHQSSFRLIVTEKRSKISGKYVEDLGWYNPHVDKSELKKERILHWLQIGAKPTDTVFNLLVSNGLINGKKIPVHKRSKKKEEGGEKTETEVKKDESSDKSQA